MKLTRTNNHQENANTITAFKNTCLASCQKILAQITRAKEAIFAESLRALKSQEHLLRLALNEAEAMAWQTRYPHLVFPTLAQEKIQAVAAWDAHQQLVRRPDRVFTTAV